MTSANSCAACAASRSSSSSSTRGVASAALRGFISCEEARGVPGVAFDALGVAVILIGAASNSNAKVAHSACCGGLPVALAEIVRALCLPSPSPVLCGGGCEWLELWIWKSHRRTSSII